MALTAGQVLGGYRLIAKIGEGGMGVVWKALDTSLDRTVAIKVLPDAFAADGERMSRFEREAKVLASLDHPGIATIHGFHQSGGVRFIAMEYVEGADLAQRVAAGPLPVEDALDVALQVASALEAAHDGGVVHRDLKPANILLGADGRVKILDFGLAKALELDPASSSSLSPTLTTPATRAGVIMGTAAYMSPEQAKGKTVDRRADIWAFGCVLYETLTGRRPFTGEGVSEILAAVIMSSADLQRLPAAVPEPARRLLSRCLEKDPRRRLRDIGEARFVLEETLAGRSASLAPAGAAAPGTRAPWPVVALAATALAAALVTWLVLRPLAPATDAPAIRRFEIAKSPAVTKELAVISPDGTRVAYVDGVSLRIRPLDRLEPIAIETGPPSFLFWSPDSRHLAWAAEGKIWKVPAEGGARAALCDLPSSLTGGEGASWGRDDRIILSKGDGDLFQLPARGGDLSVLLKIDPQKEGDFHEPHVMPDGSILFVTHVAQGRPDTIELLADGARRVLLRIEGQDIWNPIWSPSGHILYRREPANPGIWALPFALEERTATGEPFLVVPDGSIPSVSSDGTLVHAMGSRARETQLVRAGRDGKILGTIGRAQEQWPFPALSPDGRNVVISATEDEADELWIHDGVRGTTTRLTFKSNDAGDPDWSRDGSMIAFQTGSGPPFTLTIVAANGSAEPRSLGTGWGPAWSPDGRRILYTAQPEDSDWDLYYRDIAEGAEPVLFLKAPEIQVGPRFSPDGTLVAYGSRETGEPEIYIKRFPVGEGKWQVTANGGHWPVWSGDGRRLYYAEKETIMEVEVETSGTAVVLSAPRPLFTRPALGWPLVFGWPPGFDVSPDGQEFIFCQPVENARDREGIVVVANWTAGLN